MTSNDRTATDDLEWSDGGRSDGWSEDYNQSKFFNEFHNRSKFFNEFHQLEVGMGHSHCESANSDTILDPQYLTRKY